MFIHSSAEYIPQRVVDNAYFSELTGRPTTWFEQLTDAERAAYRVQWPTPQDWGDFYDQSDEP